MDDAKPHLLLAGKGGVPSEKGGGNQGEEGSKEHVRAPAGAAPPPGPHDISAQLARLQSSGSNESGSAHAGVKPREGTVSKGACLCVRVCACMFARACLRVRACAYWLCVYSCVSMQAKGTRIASSCRMCMCACECVHFLVCVAFTCELSWMCRLYGCAGLCVQGQSSRRLSLKVHWI
jgi:hypothetical protein